MTDGQTKDQATQGALDGVRVLDLTDEAGIYGAKLIADLGADVVRPEPPTGDPLRERGPLLDSADTEQETSLWHAYFASNRRFFTLDLDTAEGQQRLAQLVAKADIILASKGAFGVAAAKLDTAASERPELVIVDVSPFGQDGPWKDYQAPDLVAGALGGITATNGTAETPPLKPFGDINFMTSGVYVAIAALSALYSQREDNHGQRVSVPVHECIASCIEHVLMFYWYHETLGRDPVLPRRGAMHWSNIYTVMAAKDGHIMITPTPNIDSQIAWLVTEDAHGDLFDEKYSDPAALPLMMGRLMELLGKWVSTRGAEELFFEGQERHSPYGQVLGVKDVINNPQLIAREWFTDYQVAGTKTRAPGAPYQLSKTPWQLKDYQPSNDPQGLLADIGWGESA